MPLDSLLASAGLPPGPGRGVAVAKVTDSSNDVAPRDVFVALRGTKTDARRFVPQAVERGAAAVVVDDPTGVNAGSARLITVPDARRALACLAHAWHGHPARSMKVAGVTGTNGKTTVAHYLESVFKAAGMKPGMMGTIEYRTNETRIPAPTTTPSPLQIAALLARARDEGGSAAAIEVSSHGLDQRRVDGMAFAAAIMTNLTQDHLDYHQDMASYGAAKRRFFFDRAPGEEPKAAIFSADDPFSAAMAREYAGRKATYGLENRADVTAANIREDPAGTAFEARTPAGAAPIRVALPGRYNVLNALAVLAAGLEMGIAMDAVVAGIEALKAVPGRFERIDAGQPFALIVDYAHTPDALERILTETRRLCRRRLTAVFGCGGQRDADKRPIMGRIARQLCDYVVVTSDNPRTEDPEQIAAAIVRGIESAGGKPKEDFEVELERRAAIRRACETAREGDIIVLAGRGHEPRQLFADHSIEFDDRAVAREILTEMAKGR